jgi:hypothetical protein
MAIDTPRPFLPATRAPRTAAGSPDATFLYSGGEEGVLVQWSVRRGGGASGGGGGGGDTSRSYLPRLGAPVMRVCVGPDGGHCALTTEDNCAALVRIATWGIDWQVTITTVNCCCLYIVYTVFLQVEATLGLGH